MNQQRVKILRANSLIASMCQWLVARRFKARPFSVSKSDDIISQIVARVVAQMRENNVSILADETPAKRK